MGLKGYVAHTGRDDESIILFGRSQRKWQLWGNVGLDSAGTE